MQRRAYACPFNRKILPTWLGIAIAKPFYLFASNPVPHLVPNTLQLPFDIDHPRRRLEGESRTDGRAQPMDPTN
jgi:hypothetical protein